MSNKKIKILDSEIKRMIAERNNLARLDSIEYYESWSILRGTSRKLTQEEKDAYWGSTNDKK